VHAPLSGFEMSKLTILPGLENPVRQLQVTTKKISSPINKLHKPTNLT
jgi:hypothetical protein